MRRWGGGEDRKTKGRLRRSRWKSVATTIAQNTGKEPNRGKRVLRIKREALQQDTVRMQLLSSKMNY